LASVSNAPIATSTGRNRTRGRRDVEVRAAAASAKSDGRRPSSDDGPGSALVGAGVESDDEISAGEPAFVEACELFLRALRTPLNP
jgi:hypothetical protein